MIALANANTDLALLPIAKDKTAGATARAYVCQALTCKAPVDTPAALLAELAVARLAR